MGDGFDSPSDVELLHAPPGSVRTQGGCLALSADVGLKQKNTSDVGLP